MQTLVEKLRGAVVNLKSLCGEVVGSVLGKIKQWWLDLTNLGRKVKAWFYGEEKIKHGRHNNWGGKALAWLGCFLSPETMAEMMKQLRHAGNKSCAVVFSWFKHLISSKKFPEIIKLWWKATGYSAAAALARLQEVFPPEQVNQLLRVAWPYLVAAGGVAGVYVVFRLCCYCGVVKMMKAPGMNFTIPRRILETFPKLYFLISRILRSRC